MNARRKKQNPTPEKVKRYNQKKAIEKFRKIISERFPENALFITLKYDRQRLTKARATRDLQNYMCRLKYQCKLNYSAPPAYITVTALGKRPHHHLIMSAYEENVKQAGWNEGKLLIKKFSPELTEHLIEDMKLKDVSKMWSSSRQLKP